MFGLSPATRVFVAVDPIEMRKGFNGLFGLVRDSLDEDPLSGHLFLFTNRQQTRLKLLVFDGSGLWVCTKRLEKGRFAWPVTHPGQSRITLRPGELALLLNGIDLTQAKPRSWFRSLSATPNSQETSGL